MNHIEDVLRYISVFRGVDSCDIGLYENRIVWPQDGLVSILIKLKVVDDGVGPLKGVNLDARRSLNISKDKLEALYRNFMENRY